MGKMEIETQGHRGLGRAQERLHDSIDSYYVVGVTAKQRPPGDGTIGCGVEKTDRLGKNKEE